MDSKTGFGILLVLVGVFVAFLAVTGKAKAIITAITGTAPQPPAMQNDAGQAGAAGGGGGSWAPQTSTPAGSSSTPTTSSNVGAIATYPNDILNALAANAFIGTDGVKAVPYTASGAPA